MPAFSYLIYMIIVVLTLCVNSFTVLHDKAATTLKRPIGIFPRNPSYAEFIEKQSLHKSKFFLALLNLQFTLIF